MTSDDSEVQVDTCDLEAQLRKIETEIGARLRLRRKELGITQRELGAAAGVRYQQIQKYEAGGNRIPVSRIVQFARLLDTPVSSLLGEGPQLLDSDALQKLNEECASLVIAWARIECSTQRRHLLCLIEELARKR